MVFQIVFWISLGCILYTYIGYPVILFLLMKLRTTKRERDPLYRPTVSVLIAAYNEDRILEEKIENCLAVDYPRDRIEFLFGSDGSTDGTNAILGQHESRSIRSVIFPRRRGKASVVNDLVAQAKGEVLVFSDANTMYRPDAVQRMVSAFIDPKIGGVCGRLKLIPPGSNPGGRGESAYWEYENRLKVMEGKIKTVLGANGAIYAVRRSLVKPLPEHKALMDDFLIPLRIVEMGYDVIFEQNAVGRERTSFSMRDEYRRKVRIGAANFNTLLEIKTLLNPLRGFVAFGLWSHKVVRWFVPFLLVSLWISTLFSPRTPVFIAALVLQALFYALAVAGWLFSAAGLHSPFPGYITYFVVVHAALSVGFFKFLAGTQESAWKRVDR